MKRNNHCKLKIEKCKLQIQAELHKQNLATVFEQSDHRAICNFQFAIFNLQSKSKS